MFSLIIFFLDQNYFDHFLFGPKPSKFYHIISFGISDNEVDLTCSPVWLGFFYNQDQIIDNTNLICSVF